MAEYFSSGGLAWDSAFVCMQMAADDVDMEGEMWRCDGDGVAM